MIGLLLFGRLVGRVLVIVIVIEVEVIEFELLCIWLVVW